VARKRSNRPNWFARVQIRRGLPGFTELYDLEALSSATFQQWQAHGKAQSEYQYRLYFDLETQRAAHKAELCQALRDSASVSLNIDGWWRVIDFSYCMHALSPAGSLQWVGGRFNYGNDIDSTRFPPFPALYLAEDFTTAFRERFLISAPGEITRRCAPRPCGAALAGVRRHGGVLAGVARSSLAQRSGPPRAVHAASKPARRLAGSNPPELKQ
jgi:hypothetical protein